MIAYGIARRRRGASPPQRSMADAILGATVLAAVAPVAYAAWLTFSMGEALLLAICIGFAALDFLAAVFILGLMPIAFVAPALLILAAVINLRFALRVGNPLFILPSIAVSALALRSIARTVRGDGETKPT